jgi:Fe-Mn family superoxide dismutase
MGQYSLPKLSYNYDALEPYIDAATMNIHYNNHHATYVNNLNNALKDYPELAKKDIANLLRDLNNVPENIRTAVRNNGGGHYNHTLFWSLLAPAGSVPMPSALTKLLTDNFGSVDAFKAEFEKATASRFGSGWVWLIKTKEGKLQIISTPNQDNPIMPVAEIKGEPVLALDVWEHAYYLKYQSKRPDYVKAFWNVVNWKEVEKLVNK